MKILFKKLLKNLKDKGIKKTSKVIFGFLRNKLETEKKLKKKLKKYVDNHNKAYGNISKVAIKINYGVHPKHDILNYNEFFIKNIEAGDNILDAGCGQGQVAHAVAHKAAKVVGVDIESKNIANCQKKFHKDNLTYLVADLNDYVPQMKFDKIILSNVLEHIENRVELLKKMNDFSNTILLRVPMITRDWVTVYKKNMGLEYKLDDTHFIEYTLEQLKQEVDAAGWKINNYQINWGEFWGILNK